MTDVPRQDWAAYEARAAECDADWVRGLTLADRFALYADMFQIIWNARRGPGDWERLDRWHWEQKLAARLRMVEAYRKLDQLRRERTVADSPD